MSIANATFRPAVALEATNRTYQQIHRDVREGVVTPELPSEGCGSCMMVTGQQMLALRLYGEMLEAGLCKTLAYQASHYIERLHDLDALVDAGRGYLLIAGGEVYPDPLTLDELRGGIQNAINSAEESGLDLGGKDPMDVLQAVSINFGRTWKVMRTLLEDRAKRAAARRDKYKRQTPK